MYEIHIDSFNGETYKVVEVLTNQLVDQLSCDELIDFVRRIDVRLCDNDFTKKMFDYFLNEMDESYVYRTVIEPTLRSKF